MSIQPEVIKEAAANVIPAIVSEAREALKGAQVAIENLDKHIGFHQVKPDPGRFKEVVAGDASSRRISTCFMDFALYSAIAIKFSSWEREVKVGYINVTKTRNRGSLIYAYREKAMFNLLVKLLTKVNTDLTLVDGPLAIPISRVAGVKKEERDSFKQSIRDLLKYCEDHGIAVAGIVKMPKAANIVKRLELPSGLSPLTSDALIVSERIKRGQRTDLISPSGMVSRTMDVGYQLGSFYMATEDPRLTVPLRIDVPSFCFNEVDDIASAIYAFSYGFGHGVPYPIVLAHKGCCITDEVKRLLVQQLRSEGAKLGLMKLLRDIGSEVGL
ncbi:MAG: DNA double-strand break repair nuclease NurA [Candidatus Nezhaarchaeales archaeon]